MDKELRDRASEIYWKTYQSDEHLDEIISIVRQYDAEKVREAISNCDDVEVVDGTINDLIDAKYEAYYSVRGITPEMRFSFGRTLLETTSMYTRFIALKAAMRALGVSDE